MPVNSRTNFLDSGGLAHIEFHVDENTQFARSCNMNTKFGSFKSTLFVQTRSDIVTEWFNSQMFEHNFRYLFEREGGSSTEIHATH